MVRAGSPNPRRLFKAQLYRYSILCFTKKHLIWEIIFLHPTLLGKDWFCLRFCWENWKHRYILEAVRIAIQTCYFPGVQFCSETPCLINTRVPVLRLPLKSSSVGKSWILCIPSSFTKGTEILSVSSHFRQHLSAFKKKKKGPALWNMAEYEWTGKGLPAVFLQELLPCGTRCSLRNCNLSPPGGPSVVVFEIARTGRLKMCPNTNYSVLFD